MNPENHEETQLQNRESADEVGISASGLNLQQEHSSSSQVQASRNFDQSPILLDAVSDGICIFDRSGRICQANSTFRNWFHKSKIIGQQASAILGSTFVQIEHMLPGLLREHRETVPFETSISTDRGWMLCRLGVTDKLRSGDSDTVAVVITDISALRAAEADSEAKAADLALVNTLARLLGWGPALTETLVNIKTAMLTTCLLAGGRLLIYDAAYDLLWQGISWGVADRIPFQPVPVGEFYRDYVITRAAVDQTQEEDKQLHANTLSSYASWCLPVLSDNNLQCMMEIFSESEKEFVPARRDFYRLLGQQIGTAIQNAKLYEEVRASRERLKALSANLVQAVEAERKNLAQDLHDEVGQALLALQLAIGLNSGLSSDDQSESIRVQQNMVTELTARIRGLITDMRPGVLEEEGLPGSLQRQIDRLPKLAGLTVQLICSGCQHIRFTPELEVVFFRVAQEALTNVVRHSGAENVQVSLDCSPELLTLVVSDNGSGFDVYSKLSESNHYGLVGMFERAQAVNATLNIVSSPATGTKLTLSATSQALT